MAVAQENRFHGRASLKFVFNRGQIVRGPDISLRYVLNSRRQTYRLAVVVSRKVNKSAVVRNRIRRRINELVRLSAQQMTGPYDLVFMVFSDNAAEMDSAKLEQIVTGCLKRAGVVSS